MAAAFASGDSDSGGGIVMTGLENWLKQATRRLSRESAARVRSEIQEHYESARETAMAEGATADEADLTALAALGDAKIANCQYREVLLSSDEARLLSEGNWEARAICFRPWLKWLLITAPVVALFLIATRGIAPVVLAAGLMTGLLFAAVFLPIYTPRRARIFRCAKWVVFIAIFALIFGADTLRMSWLLISCLWPVAWIEWKRVSIRRKLPVAEWPRQLYL